MSVPNCRREVLGDIHVYSVLDVGCGTGAFTRTLAEMLGSVEQLVGIDPDKDSLDEARQITDDERITFRLLSGYAMPYADGRFDLAGISDALHHVPDPVQLLSLMMQATATEGWVVVQELVSDGLSRSEENGRDMHHFKSQIDRLNGRVHNATFSRAEIRDIVRNAGLEIDAECEVTDPMDPTGTEMTQRVAHAQTFLPEYLEHARETLAFEDLTREARRIADRISVHGISTPPQLLIRARKA